MKVLLTVHRFWPSVGGTEAIVEGLAGTLASRGHEVTVATSAEPGAPAEETRHGYRIRRFDLVRKGRFRFPGRDYRDFIRHGGWDVWNLHGQRVWSSDYAYDVARRTPTPVVFTGHGFYQYHMGRLRPVEWAYYRVALPWGLKRAHCVAKTRGERDELVGFGFDPDRIRVVPCALEPAAFQVPMAGFRKKYGFQEGSPLLLYVGGFYANKGVDDVVRLSARTGFPAAVVGPDPDPRGRGIARGRALARDLGAPVAFLGRIPRDDVLSAFQESTLLVLPSRFEGFGLVLLEAMAAGLPFVASRAGAAPELAERGCGVSVAGLDAMVRAVESLVADEAGRARMANVGRDQAREFTWDRVVRGYEDTYAEAVRLQGGRGP